MILKCSYDQWIKRHGGWHTKTTEHICQFKSSNSFGGSWFNHILNIFRISWHCTPLKLDKKVGNHFKTKKIMNSTLWRRRTDLAMWICRLSWTKFSKKSRKSSILMPVADVTYIFCNVGYIFQDVGIGPCHCKKNKVA